jgi:hypothetical protein
VKAARFPIRAAARWLPVLLVGLLVSACQVASTAMPEVDIRPLDRPAAAKPWPT